MADAEQSNKPSHSDFKQQTLKAWRPVLTPKTVLPTFVGVGIVFLAVGIALLVENGKVEEFTWDYTSCNDSVTNKPCEQLTTNTCLGKGAGCTQAGADFDFTYVTNPNGADAAKRCVCQSEVMSLSGMSGSDAFMYYALDNYYQNHRRYVDSRSDPQLRSKQDEANEECNPIESEAVTFKNNKTRTLYYAPCGLIANSLFNDTIELYKCSTDNCDITNTAEATKMALDGAGISWKSDREVKFKNPDTSDGELCNATAWSDTRSLSPPNWPVKTCEVGRGGANPSPRMLNYNPWSPEFGSNGVGYENEDFIVWMRTAALPNFRKLYRKLGRTLVDGKYKMKVGYNYPVTAFDGKKKVVISTTSSIGGKNAFLGVAYLIVGCLALGAAATFFICMKYRGDDVANQNINDMRW